MKLTSILFSQHLGRMFREHWKVQGQRVAYDNGSLKSLKEKGLEYEDALEFINKKQQSKIIRKKEAFPVKDSFEKKVIRFEEPSPDDNVDTCLAYSNESVLLEGLKQAQALTNTQLVDHTTHPLSTLKLHQTAHEKLVRRCIRSSLLFDGWQGKLPKRKDPAREAWNFARDYGITDTRRNCLLVQRFLQLCSSLSPQLLSQRAILNSANFTLPYTLQSGQRLLFSIRGDTVVLSDRSPFVKVPEDVQATPVPDISPLFPTVSLQPTTILQFEPHFPVNDGNKLGKLHTVVLHYNETEVANIFESPVTLDQILGRTLVHSWVYAMSQALKNGDKDPVNVQTVQTNGQFFHFGVLQLRSQTLDSEPNLFWSFPIMNLFDTCKYENGVPVLEGYNSDVFKTLLAFYNNS